MSSRRTLADALRADPKVQAAIQRWLDQVAEDEERHRQAMEVFVRDATKLRTRLNYSTGRGNA